MNIIFLGMIYGKNDEKKYLAVSKTGLPAAVNNYQTEVIKGLSLNKESISVISSAPFGIFPSACKKLFVKSREYVIDAVSVSDIGYLNIPVIKQLMRYAGAVRKLKHRVNAAGNGDVFILTYGLYTPYLRAMAKIKSRYKNVKCGCIIADLPLKYGVMPNNRLKKLVFTLYGKSELRALQVCDKFVLLSEEMREELSLLPERCTVVEAIVSPRQEIKAEKNNVFTVFYGGSLDTSFGIKGLLAAAEELKNLNIDFVIAGAGDAEDEVRRCASNNPHVKFLGYITKDEVYEQQKRAWLLVNPRTPEGEYTKYSFPSKTTEYLASGTPLAAYRLPCYPPEYEDYIYFTDYNEKRNALASEIKRLSKKDTKELCCFGNKAKEFVLTEKNCAVQTAEIISLIRGGI